MGSVDFAGVLAQAPGSDTVGWFARDAETFARVGEAVFGAPTPASLPRRLIVATDTFAFADAEVATALEPMVERLASLIGERRDRILAPQGLSVWQAAQRCLQSSRGVANVSALDRRLQSAVRVQCRARADAGVDDHRQRTHASRPDARGGAGTIAYVTTARNDFVLADHAVSGAETRAVRLRSGVPAGADFRPDLSGGLTGVPQVNLPGATVGGGSGRLVGCRGARDRPGTGGPALCGRCRSAAGGPRGLMSLKTTIIITNEPIN